ncbi:hypothetical protein Tco_1563145 [Tanacetum coccineum]
MAISVISIFSDSSEESVGTSIGRVILFDTIPTTVPATAPTANLPYTSPFICIDSSDNDTPDIPSPPTLRQILPAPLGLPRRPTVIVLPGMRVGPLPTHRIALRYSADYSSSDHFTSDDSSRDCPSDSLSKTSSDSPCDSPTAISARPSRKRRRSSTTSVPVSSPIPRALSPIRVDLLPPHKRIRDFDSVTVFKVSLEEGFVPYVPREIGLGVDVEDSYKPYIEPDIDPDVGTAAEEEAESSARGTIKIVVDRVTHPVVPDDTTEPVREDYPELISANGSLEVMERGLDVVMKDLYDHIVEIPVHRFKVIESIQRDQGHRNVVTIQQCAAMSEMISTLEGDNMRLRGMLGVERRRVDCLRRSMSTMPTTTCSRITRDAIDEMISKRVAEALEAYDAVRNPGTETEMKDKQQDDNVKANGNNGNGTVLRNGKPLCETTEVLYRYSRVYPTRLCEVLLAKLQGN